MDTVTLVTFIAASICAFMVGRTYELMSRDEVISSTIQYLCDNGFIRYVLDENNEIEILKLDEENTDG